MADLGAEYIPNVAFTEPWEAHVSALYDFCHAFSDLGTMWDPVSGLHLNLEDRWDREFDEGRDPSLKLAREERDQNKISIDIKGICHDGVLKKMKRLKGSYGNYWEYIGELRWAVEVRDGNIPGYRPTQMDQLAWRISFDCDTAEREIRLGNAAVTGISKLIQELDFVTNLVTWILRDFRRPPQRSIWSIAYCVLPFTRGWGLDSYCMVEAKKGRLAASARLLASNIQGSNGSLDKLRQDLVAKVKTLSALLAARQELLDEMKDQRDEASLLWQRMTEAIP